MKIYESVSMKNIRFCMTYAPDYGYTSFEEILVEAPEHVLRLIKDKYYQCTSLALQFIKEIADIPIKSLRQEYYDDNSFDYYLKEEEDRAKAEKNSNIIWAALQELKRQEKEEKIAQDNAWIEKVVEHSKKKIVSETMDGTIEWPKPEFSTQSGYKRYDRKIKYMGIELCFRKQQHYNREAEIVVHYYMIYKLNASEQIINADSLKKLWNYIEKNTHS